jgi:hypothetical protein
MSEPPKLQVGDLNREEMEDIVEKIRDILWPRGKEEAPWSPDTIDAIASVMDEYHLRP